MRPRAKFGRIVTRSEQKKADAISASARFACEASLNRSRACQVHIQHRRWKIQNREAHARHSNPNPGTNRRGIRDRGELHPGEARFHPRSIGFQPGHERLLPGRHDLEVAGGIFRPQDSALDSCHCCLHAAGRGFLLRRRQLRSSQKQVGTSRRHGESWSYLRLDAINHPSHHLVRPGGTAVLINSVQPQRHHSRHQPTPRLCFHRLIHLPNRRPSGRSVSEAANKLSAIFTGQKSI